MSAPLPEAIEDIDDFGFFHDLETVQLAAIGLNRFHFLPYPGGFFDQPYELLFDILRYLNISDVVRGKPYYPGEVYEDQSIEDEIKAITF